MTLRLAVAVLIALCLLGAVSGRSEFIWIEGEKPAINKMNRHPWWYDQVKKDQFSGGDFVSNFNKDKPGEAEYHFNATKSGEYEFWIRANPLQAILSYTLNGSGAATIDLTSDKRDEINVAADDKPDLRFLAWSKVGKVPLKAGANTITFRMNSANNNHGYLDCFVFSTEPILPKGAAKPGATPGNPKDLAGIPKGWLPFDPKPDKFTPDALLDLRFLNEKYAGAHGFIAVRNGEFVRSGDGQALRFWAVNGPPHELKGEALRNCARMLAKRGVNMVRVHSGYFDGNGEVDEKKVRHAFEIVDAMKAEGIYTHFSIYFPLWLSPKATSTWLKGYDGTKHPFAALLFNPDFQAQYRKWWTALLTTPNPSTGKTLAEEPAVSSVELQNEDSFFFWTFDEKNIPDPELRILEQIYGSWLAAKYGSLETALQKWNGQKAKRDAPREGRMGFRPLWNMFNERSTRDQDAAEFLLHAQMKFYTEAKAFLRQLGFKGPITPSNWTTASAEVLGPLEKLSYTTGDFIDRHGYFDCNHKGQNSEWSIRASHTWSDRSAYRFDPGTPGKPKQFLHPAMDPHYDNLPSMISEITWNRPNRFRSEAPIYLAAYGALQHSDGIVHFALDGGQWSVKPGFWMQPWTLMSPTMMGQFPAAALIFRKGLISVGDRMAEVDLNTNDLIHLKGTPLAQGAALDELRLKDVPQGTEVKPGQQINPLIHYVGRTDVRFVSTPSATRLKDSTQFIDVAGQTVSSSTRELKLDYGKGVLTLAAAKAQGVSGLIGTLGKVETPDLLIESQMELGNILAVPLDDQPLATSGKILLQAMSEERESKRREEQASRATSKITTLGSDPWLIKELQGIVRFKRPDAAKLKVTALDANGYGQAPAGNASEINLRPDVLYYLITN